MKQCPSCKTTYTDPTLRYCLADGAILVDPSGGEPTLVRRADDFHAGRTVAMGTTGQPVCVEIPQPTAQTVPQAVYPTAAPVAAGTSGTLFKVLMVLVGLSILAVLIVGVGALVYLNMPGSEKISNAATNKEVRNTVSPTPSPAKDDKNELRDQIANLEKLLNEQNKNNKGANVPLTLPNQPATTTIARVNSPGDGFLALRTMPNSEAGSRILQIPHGASVTVGGCLNSMRIGGKSGRWCRASYNGYSGWVFDAFLVY